MIINNEKFFIFRKIYSFLWKDSRKKSRKIFFPLAIIAKVSFFFHFNFWTTIKLLLICQCCCCCSLYFWYIRSIHCNIFPFHFIFISETFFSIFCVWKKNCYYGLNTTTTTSNNNGTHFECIYIIIISCV